MTRESHAALKFEKKRPDFLKFAVYGTRETWPSLQIPYREALEQFVSQEYLKTCACIKTQKTRSRGQPDARRTDLSGAKRGCGKVTQNFALTFFGERKMRSWGYALPRGLYLGRASNALITSLEMPFALSGSQSSRMLQACLVQPGVSAFG